MKGFRDRRLKEWKNNCQKAKRKESYMTEIDSKETLTLVTPTQETL